MSYPYVILVLLHATSLVRKICSYKLRISVGVPGRNYVYSSQLDVLALVISSLEQSYMFTDAAYQVIVFSYH